MSEATISFRGVRLLIKFDYTPPVPATYWEPGWDAEYDIWSVLHEGYEIQDLLDDSVLDDIVEELEKI